MNRYVRIAKYAGLKQTGALVESLGDLKGDPRPVFATLRNHGLIGLFLSIVPESDIHAVLPATVLAELEVWRRRPRPSNHALLSGFAEARNVLHPEDVPVLLLKGFYFAQRLYGGVAYRPQFDVDVLVHNHNFRRAIPILARNGFVRQAYDLHSSTLVRDGWKLDVHRCLRRAPAFRVDERPVWSSAIDMRVEDVAFRTLSDEWHLVLLVLGTFEDLGQGMTKLRQLLDLYLLLQAIDANFPWGDFFVHRQAENLSGVAANILSLVVRLFEAETEVPRLMAALAACGDRVQAMTDAETVDLVFAVRKRPENLAWFARIYPGSLRLYLAEFWYGGFPQNLKDFSARRLTSTLRVSFGGGSKGARG